MSEAAALEKEIRDLVAASLHVDVPSPELDLFETGVVDSLMFVKLLAELEERYGFQLSFDELEINDFRTLRNIARFVAKRSPVSSRA